MSRKSVWTVYHGFEDEAFCEQIGHSHDRLWHVLHSYIDQWNGTETKPIGLYSDPELARNAVRDRLTQPLEAARMDSRLFP